MQYRRIVWAGRRPDTRGLNLQQVGVKVDEESGKVVGDHEGDHERSSISNIYAIGDVLHVRTVLWICVMWLRLLLVMLMMSSNDGNDDDCDNYGKTDGDGVNDDEYIC